MMGFNTTGDAKVSITVRDWEALRRGLWRSKIALGIVERQQLEIIARCRHDTDCPGATDESEPCFASCPDREIRMSALVSLGAARQLAPHDARTPANGPYFAPTREYFSEILSDLAAAQTALVAFRTEQRSVSDIAEELVRTAPPKPAPTINRLASHETTFKRELALAGAQEQEDEAPENEAPEGDGA